MLNSRLIKALEAIEAYDDAVYFVGGCLRQFLLKQPIHDYDFVCQSSAIALARHLGQVLQAPFFVLDENRDIARVVLSATDTLDFATLQGNRLSEDLALRDLTINAMAYPAGVGLLNHRFDPHDLIDPMGGFKDLKKGIIRGISESNFISDPLRLLRIFRFAAQHQFTIESTTLNWVKQHASLIHRSAVERVLSELFKILSAPGHLTTLYQMLTSHLLQAVIPVSAADLESNLGIYGRWIDRVKDQTDYSAYLATPITGEHRRGMLIQLYLLCFSHYFTDNFQDLKKSSIRSHFDNGRQFMSTQKKEMPVIGGLSRNEWSFFEKISDVFLWGSLDKLKSPVEKSRLVRQAKPELAAVILMSRALYDCDTSPAAALYLEQLKIIEALWQDPYNRVAHPQLFLTGHEIAQLLNQKPGPQIGRVLNQLLDAQALSQVFDYDSAVAYVKGLSTNNG